MPFQSELRVRLTVASRPRKSGFSRLRTKVEYLVNMAANAVLKRKAEAAMKRARRASEISGQTEHVYGECRYATKKTWPWKRRSSTKPRWCAPRQGTKDNPRFVVTNLKQSPQWIYEKTYCQRGDVETGLKNCTMACRSAGPVARTFWRHVRVLLTAAAYVLMQRCAFTWPRLATPGRKSRPCASIF